MLKILPQNKIITPSSYNPSEVVDYVNNYIQNYNCKDICVDISFLNIIDACYISTLCSTKHFIKYPDGRITWKVSSALVQEFNKKLDLKNCDYYF